jgi:hypothetical protein
VKTVSITIDDGAWETMQRLAQSQGKPLDDVLASATEALASAAATPPSCEERRRFLDKLWDRIDACNVEVGEQPSRARTYDYRRFHRY